MSHKGKRLARELSKKSGMTYQAALNAQPQMIKCPRSDMRQTFSFRCKSCRRWIWSGSDERKGACACPSLQTHPGRPQKHAGELPLIVQLVGVSLAEES